MSDSSGRDIAVVLAEFARTMAEEPTPQHILERLGDYCTEMLPVHGVGILLRTSKGGIEVGTANSELGRVVEELEVELGEGPCTECVETGEQIAVPDIALAASRYPRFTPRALQAGVRAIHALPMTVRAEQIGAMDMVATEPVDLSAQQLATAQLLADVSISFVANSRAFREKTELAAQLQHALDSRITIEQAKGILSERHDLTVTDAFERMRQHARGNQRKLHDVASEIVRGDLDL
jgi:hypothetical protein